MAKRFTDTNKYKKPFLRGLQGAYKLLWDFICCDCDHAGIWIVDFEIAQICIGKDMRVTKDDALGFFNEGEERIVVIEGGKKWFIPSFIEFQYGRLHEKNRAHVSVINVLSKYGLLDENFSISRNKLHTSPLQDAKEQEQEKVKEKEPEQENVKTGPLIMPGAQILIVPELVSIWKKHRPQYVVIPGDDFHEVRAIAEMICKADNLTGYTDLANIDRIKYIFETLVEFSTTHTLYKDFQLSQFRKYFNAIGSACKNKNSNAASEQKSGIIRTNIDAAQGATEILKQKYANNGNKEGEI